MKRANRRNITLHKHKLDELLQRIETRQFRPGDHELIEMLFASYSQLIHSLKDEKTTMDQLRKLLAAVDTEMTEAMTDSETEPATPPVPLDDDGGTESS